MEVFKHCCEGMRIACEFSCTKCHDEWACSDTLIKYLDKFEEYGIIIHDGTSSISHIDFCPYCGVTLPTSRRDEYFDLMDQVGLDPWDNPEEAKKIWTTHRSKDVS